MTLLDFYKTIPMLQIKDACIALLALFVVITGCIEIVPVKINPWTAILWWIGSRINCTVNERIKNLEKKQEDFEKKFDDYVEERDKKDLDDLRAKILQFCNECMNRKLHTREQFRHIIRLCDEYEKYIEDHNLKNGEITDAVERIRNIHRKCLAENKFLEALTKKESESTQLFKGGKHNEI